MSLRDALLASKSKLKPTVTTVLRADGTEIEEHRGEDGKFEATDGKVSNRRKKKVERTLRAGYVIDLKPDLQVAQCRPGLYVGSQDVAADQQILRRNGITHIVNCASNVRCFFPKLFKYLNIDLLDLPETNLLNYVEDVHRFIYQAISEGGKVFVHCNAGISRAPSLCLSFMMRYDHLKYFEALEKLRITRPGVRPNDGFLEQLSQYELQLKLFSDEDRTPPPL